MNYIACQALCPPLIPGVCSNSCHLRRRKWQPTPVFLPRESCGQRSLGAAVHRVAKSWTRLKQLSMHACIGEGHGNPFQYSCPENPRDRGAWWAARHRVGHDWSDLAAAACPLSYLTILSSATPFSFCLHSFPALGSFQLSQLLTLGGQSIGVSANPSNENSGLTSFNWLNWSPCSPRNS